MQEWVSLTLQGTGIILLLQVLMPPETMTGRSCIDDSGIGPFEDAECQRLGAEREKIP